MKKTKIMVTAAMMASFTCIATMVIKIPTPTFGYIHLGDGLVLLCGILLGPWVGGLAAGIGSFLSDLFLGYVAFAPGTFFIKALCAAAAGLIYHTLTSTNIKKINRTAAFLGGILGEFLMVIGYFLYEALLAAITAGSINQTTLISGFASSALGIPFNIMQGITGILICILVLPMLPCKDSD